MHRSKGSSADEHIRVTPREATVILAPYIGSKFWEQFSLVIPIVAYLVLFQVIVLRESVEQALQIGWGVFCVIIGLMFFMEGLRLGLMPFSERIGAGLPQNATLPIVLGFAFLVGIGATLAEPSISVLRSAGASINPEKAPLLHYLLNQQSTLLVICIGIGVGIAALLGILRIIRDWRLGVLIVPTVIAALALTVIASLNETTAPIVGLAWDSGAVTTGPVTVPLVLALGIGLAAAVGRADTGKAGFGIVTLASLFPIIAVLLLGLSLFHFGAADFSAMGDIAGTLGAEGAAPVSIGSALLSSLISAFQAIVPLVVFLYLVLAFLVRIPLEHPREVWLGISFAVFGMFLFNLGLGTGLSPLGGQVGSTLPTAFNPPGEALLGEVLGRAVTIIFAFLMGYGATLAEPALNALAIKVEEITVGAFKRNLLMHTVAFGVGIGVALGVTKLLFEISLVWFLLPLYILLLPITAISSEAFVNIGWDSAGVTTGPITVPLVIALGLGLGSAMNVVEGFGILAMASVCPIIAVLTMGLLAGRRREKHEETLEEGEDI
jgi:hypothetical protein